MAISFTTTHQVSCDKIIETDSSPASGAALRLPFLNDSSGTVKVRDLTESSNDRIYFNYATGTRSLECKSLITTSTGSELKPTTINGTLGCYTSTSNKYICVGMTNATTMSTSTKYLYSYTPTSNYMSMRYISGADSIQGVLIMPTNNASTGMYSTPAVVLGNYGSFSSNPTYDNIDASKVGLIIGTKWEYCNSVVFGGKNKDWAGTLINGNINTTKGIYTGGSSPTRKKFYTSRPTVYSHSIRLYYYNILSCTLQIINNVSSQYTSASSILSWLKSAGFTTSYIAHPAFGVARTSLSTTGSQRNILGICCYTNGSKDVLGFWIINPTNNMSTWILYDTNSTPITSNVAVYDYVRSFE